jgi:hypothetical protein
MGRSIPSFRQQLLEIEKLNYLHLRRCYQLKEINMNLMNFLIMIDCIHRIFNASNPIPIESIFMGAIFHIYKMLLQSTREDSSIGESTLKDERISLFENKPEGKILFYFHS